MPKKLRVASGAKPPMWQAPHQGFATTSAPPSDVHPSGRGLRGRAAALRRLPRRPAWAARRALPRALADPGAQPIPLFHWTSGLSGPLARRRHGGGPAQLPTAPGGRRHLAHHAQRYAPLQRSFNLIPSGFPLPGPSDSLFGSKEFPAPLHAHAPMFGPAERATTGFIAMPAVPWSGQNSLRFPAKFPDTGNSVSESGSLETLSTTS